MVKLSDIARLAQTSTSTVSKVLNDYEGVSELTKQRVLDAVKTLGYVPNASARQLITRRSFLAGLIFTENLNVGLEHPFYGGVLEGFLTHMNANGYDVIFISPQQKDGRISYLDHCRYRNVDGVFVCTFAGDDRELIHLFESGIPCVTTDVDYKKIPLINSDNVGATKTAYDYLHGLGHRDIVHINGPLNTLSARERLSGFKESLYQYDVHQNPNLFIEAHDYDYESGVLAAQDLLKKRGKNLPDAIIAAADIIALGLINELFRHGVRVPNDISVIGFDNIEMSEYVNPGLTTMAQDRRKIGELSAQALIARIEGKKVNDRTMIPMEVVERSTCRIKL